MDAFRFHMLCLPVLLALTSGTAQAQAEASTQTQHEPIQRHWYVGGFWGQAKGEVGDAKMNQRMTQQGHDIQAKVDHLARESFSVLAGYQWSDYLAMEAAYTDLGEVETRLNGDTAEIQNLLRSADLVHPASADGYEISLYGRYPLNHRWALFARGGWMYSDSDYSARATSGERDKLKEDGTIQLFGLGADFKPAPRWTVRAAASRYQLDQENVDVIGLGLLYRFVREPQKIEEPVKTAAAPVSEPAPIIATEPPQPVQISLRDALNQQGFSVQQGDRGLTVSLEGVLFATNSSVLTEKGMEAVLRVAALLQSNPGYNIAVEGHTDSRGRPDKNLRLSQNRAISVLQTLLNAGVSADRITARGYGAQYPIASNAEEAGRQLNRRVEFVFSAQSGEAVPERKR